MILTYKKIENIYLKKIHVEIVVKQFYLFLYTLFKVCLNILPKHGAKEVSTIYLLPRFGTSVEV